MNEDVQHKLFVADSISVEIKTLKVKVEELISEAQSICEHPLTSIRKGKQKSNSFTIYAPWRVCIECGLAEEGWGSGYKNLGRSVYSGIARLDWSDLQPYMRTRVRQ